MGIGNGGTSNEFTDLAQDGQQWLSHFGIGFLNGFPFIVVIVVAVAVAWAGTVTLSRIREQHRKCRNHTCGVVHPYKCIATLRM